MIRALLILTVMVMSAATANAGLSRGDLATVSATLPPNAHIALDISLHDTAGRALTMRQLLDGRSALVTFVDFTCTSLCGSDLRLLSGAIEAAGIT
ncbi:MAG: hypothetical protein ACXWIM_18855, partial [Burkholderiales bacterium]